MLFNETITFRELGEIMNHAYRNKRSLMVYGSSGIGKSAYIAQWTKDVLKSEILVDFRLCLESVESIGGQWIPEQTEENGLTMLKALPSVWEPLLKDGAVGVLFMDEITSCAPAKQALSYQVLHDRTIGGRKISDGILIIGAGNMLDSGGLVFELLKPVANRVLQVQLMSTGVEATKIYVEDFAIPANMSTAVITYLEDKPQNINKNEEESSCPAWPSQRSWFYVSGTVLEYEAGLLSENMMYKIINGYVGESYARDFKAHYVLGKDMPRTQAILDGANPLLKDTVDYKAKAYITGCCAALWKMRFLDVSISDEVLLQEIDNLVAWCHGNFSTRGAERDIITAQIKGMLNYTQEEDRQNKTGRKGFKLKMISQTKGVAAIIGDWNDVNTQGQLK